MSRPRLGEPIEVPWWVPLGSAPPLAVIVGTLVVGAAWARVAGAVFSAGMVAVLVLVSHRVSSASMQSVWISAAYAVWFFAALIWLVSALHP